MKKKQNRTSESHFAALEDLVLSISRGSTFQHSTVVGKCLILGILDITL